jgi:hypothetical protein
MPSKAHPPPNPMLKKPGIYNSTTLKKTSLNGARIPSPSQTVYPPRPPIHPDQENQKRTSCMQNPWMAQTHATQNSNNPCLNQPRTPVPSNPGQNQMKSHHEADLDSMQSKCHLSYGGNPAPPTSSTSLSPRLLSPCSEPPTANPRATTAPRSSSSSSSSTGAEGARTRFPMPATGGSEGPAMSSESSGGALRSSCSRRCCSSCLSSVGGRCAEFGIGGA